MTYEEAVSQTAKRYGCSASEAAQMLKVDVSCGYLKLSNMSEQDLDEHWQRMENWESSEAREVVPVYYRGWETRPLKQQEPGAAIDKHPYRPAKEPKGPISFLTFSKMSKRDQQIYLRKLRDRESRLLEQIVQLRMQAEALRIEIHTLEPPVAVPLVAPPEELITHLPEKREPQKRGSRLVLELA